MVAKLCGGTKKFGEMEVEGKRNHDGHNREVFLSQASFLPMKSKAAEDEDAKRYGKRRCKVP